ncbi:MAG: DsbA family oxidoreductase, partial [Stellaceae bacterium]
YADLVCPWCFIGKRRLERAVAMRPEITIGKSWRPYRLNPDLPAGGVPAAQFWAEKFGSPTLIEERRAAVRDAGASVGIAFAFERIGREPNTLDAHRMVRFAAAHDQADEMAEALFAAHFLAGRDIGDATMLTEIAGEIGLDAGAVRDFLAGDGERSAVAAAGEEAHRVGVTAVPCYVFERQYAVAGAQEPEFFLPIFDLVASRRQA